jgi:hypothetical protein
MSGLNRNRLARACRIGLAAATLALALPMAEAAAQGYGHHSGDERWGDERWRPHPWHGGGFDGGWYGPGPVVVLPPPVYAPPPGVVVVPPPYYGDSPYAAGPAYALPPLSAQPGSAPYIAANGQYCRDFQSSAVIDGVTRPIVGTACRQPDGSWQVVR